MTALIVFLAGTDRPACMIALKPMSQPRAAQESPLKVTDTPPSKFLLLSAAISNEPECHLPTGPEETEMSSRVSVRLGNQLLERAHHQSRVEENSPIEAGEK